MIKKKVGICDILEWVGVVLLIVLYVLNGIVLILDEVCNCVLVIVQEMGYLVKCQVKGFIVVL